MSYIPEPRAPGGPPQYVRWLGFIGWLVVPVLLTAAIVELTTLFVLWWGVVWFAFALMYIILYFRWAKKKYSKIS